VNFTDNYLNSLGREPLLTANEELHLARLIQAGQAPDATPLQKRRAVRARNRMVAANLRLAVNLAAKLRRRRTSMDLQDLVQEAVFGLMRAAEKFDPSLGYKFSTYAYAWINQALTRSVAAKDHVIYIPLHIGNTLYRMRRQIEEAQHAGRPISMEQAAEAAGVTVHDGWRAGLRVESVGSLNEIVGRDEDSELVHLIASDPSDSGVTQELGIDRDQLDAALSMLPPRWEQIIRGSYGIGREAATRKELSQELSISPQTVTDTLARARKRLRLALTSPHDPCSPDRPAVRPAAVVAPHLARSASSQPPGADAAVA